MARIPKTSTGCVTCRRRRKKCDESKPQCGACTRLKLQCTWQPPTSSKSKDNIVARLPALPRYQTGQMASGFQAFSSQAEFHFAITGPQLFSLLLSVAARPLWPDTSCLLSLVLTRHAVRSALVAFSAKTKSYEIQSQQALSIAERAYHSAIVQTQQLLSAGIQDADILPAITVVLCMGLFEGIGDGNMFVAADHFSAALLLISAHTTRSQVLPSASERQFFLVALEVSLVFVSGVALFQPSLDLLARLDWPSIRIAIARHAPFLLSENNLPCLERHEYIEIFISIQQTAYLARQKSSPQRWEAAKNLWLTVEKLEYRLKTYDSTDLVEEVHQVYFHRWGLMIDSVRVLLLKIIDEEVCSGHHFIKTLVKSATYHLHPTTVGAASPWSLQFPAPFSNIHLPMLGPFWWFFVLVCAVHEYELPKELQVVYHVLSSVLATEYRLKLLQLVTIIKKRKTSTSGVCEADSGACSIRHDGLDFLLHPRGIFGILEDQT